MILTLELAPKWRAVLVAAALAVLLAAPYEVVDSAPIEGFLHRTNELDTLGDDEPESPCHLAK